MKHVIDMRPTKDGADPVEYLEGIVTVLTHLHNNVNALRSRASVPITCAEAIPISSQSQKLAVSAVRLAGYSLHETTGTTGAVIRLHDGISTDGDSLVPISLGMGESVRDWFGDQRSGGVAFPTGMYLEVVSGSLEGSIWVYRNTVPR